MAVGGHVDCTGAQSPLRETLLGSGLRLNCLEV